MTTCLPSALANILEHRPGAGTMAVVGPEAAALLGDTPQGVAALPPTASEAEALARALDDQRAEVAREHHELTRSKPSQIDRAWSDAMAANTRRGLALDAQRGAAWRVARELRDTEARRAQWAAAFAVAPEHREVCAQITAALDLLIPAIVAEQQLHAQLAAMAGASQLHDLRADLVELRRLRTSAALVTHPPEAT